MGAASCVDLHKLVERTKSGDDFIHAHRRVLEMKQKAEDNLESGEDASFDRNQDRKTLRELDMAASARLTH